MIETRVCMFVKVVSLILMSPSLVQFKFIPDGKFWSWSPRGNTHPVFRARDLVQKSIDGEALLFTADVERLQVRRHVRPPFSHHLLPCGKENMVWTKNTGSEFFYFFLKFKLTGRMFDAIRWPSLIFRVQWRENVGSALRWIVATQCRISGVNI